ncbi:MAG: polyketide cyclase [Nocardioides sp.]|uniref:SRPBCC family protein n=1 Tax=Nocardioides sp. TaxID=35761 RepID=UPI0039E61A3C
MSRSGASEGSEASETTQGARSPTRRRFVFDEAWAAAAAVDAVAEVLVDLEHYPEWWPQVLAVAKIDDGTARVLCRSTLPYTLDLVLTALTREPPVVEVGLSGDLVGHARFALTPTSSGGTRLAFHQDVELTGLLAVASYAVRPVLTWNHRRMMAGCRAGLAARLSDGR